MSLSKDLNLNMTAVDFNPFATGELLSTAPATESQKEIWASVQMGKEANCAYNESQTLWLKGCLNLDGLKTAIHELIDRHEALRTTFSPDGNTLCIANSLAIEIPFIDLSELAIADKQTTFFELQKNAVESPFDVEHGPLFWVQLIKQATDEHSVILTAHHLICDGWSWAVLMQDLGILYSAHQNNEIPELEEAERLSDYAISLTDSAEEAEMAETVDYWLQQFSQSVPVLDFPTDRPRPPLRTFNAAREDWELPEVLITQLKQLGTSLGCSFMTTILSGFEVFLHRLTSQADIIVGVPAAGQAVSGQYHLVGHCVNLLPLRSHVDSQLPFSAYLKSRQSTILDAYDHQQFTFGSLVKKLALPRDASRIPLVPVLFNVDQGLDSDKLPFADLEVKFFSNPRSYENFELFINATELKGKVTLECQYNTNLFNLETIRRRLAEFQTLLEGIVTNPEQTIATLPLLPKAEQNLLIQWNNRLTTAPLNQCIHQLVEAQAAKTPQAIAVIFEDQSITYQGLNQKANQVAHYLQALGVGPEVLVGLCCDRSLEMVIGVIGILKAGAAYVPLDPAYPQERLAFMIEDAQITTLLTQAHLTANFSASQATLICLDTDWQTIAAVNSGMQSPTSNVTPDNLAYIIYTSGSTGKPKGVQIPHRNVVNLLTSVREQPGLTTEDTLLSVTTLSFDISVSEVFLPLIVGAKLLIASRAVAADGLQLRQLIETCKPTFMQPTPATWRMLLAAGWTGNPNLKIISTGEPLPKDLANQLLPLGKELWNLYGPTETTIWSTGYQVQLDDRPITIGYPVANTQLYILDKNDQPVPIGVPGELHIGGAGIARGYLNRPELTTAKFVPHPFTADPTARLYKTGDLARWLPNGQVECLGRIDYQVKLRGFRIELGEIEANLLQHPFVKEAVVILREDYPNEKHLVGYFVLADQAKVNNETIAELRQFMQQALPDFMVPTYLMALQAMPLTPNGKVDRKALPKVDIAQQLTNHYVAPRTELEQQIADIWTEVMHIERIGIHDNFFELGGHSILAIQVIARLRKMLQLELPLTTLFERPTVEDFAKRIDTLRWAAQAMSTSQPMSTAEYEEGEL